MNVIPATRILAVDDRPENLLTLREILRPLEVEIMEAGSGEDALKLLLKHEFALILLDVNMPGMDGFATAEFIKKLEKTRYIPIIFISGEKRDADHVLSGYETGAVDYLVKPFSSQVLLSKASVFVDLYEKDRALRESEERFRSAFDNAPIGIALLATNGRGMEVNEALTSLLGRSREQLQKMRFLELIHEDDRTDVSDVLKEVAMGSEACRFFELRCVHSDGSDIPAGLAVSLIPGVGEEPQHLVVQVQDLSELRRAQEYRRQLEAMKARQLEALEINDAVVQGLVIAKYALELGYDDKLMESLDYTLRSAQSIVTGLLQETGRLGFRPGDLARATPEEAGVADRD